MQVAVIQWWIHDRVFLQNDCEDDASHQTANSMIEGYRANSITCIIHIKMHW